MNNENMVSIDWVLSALHLNEMPKPQAFNIIASYVSNENLNMYFDKFIVGTDAIYDIELQYDENEEIIGGLIGNGYSFEHHGKKLATSVDATYSDGKFKFVVNAYYFNKKRFYSTDAEGIWHREYFIDVELVYFDRKEITLLASKFNNLPSTKGYKGYAEELGAKKALALLAREAAEKSSKFRHGNKVNAKAFKDHIIALENEYAKKYQIPKGHLQKLDDKINQELNKFDLKDLPKE